MAQLSQTSQIQFRQVPGTLRFTLTNVPEGITKSTKIGDSSEKQNGASRVDFNRKAPSTVVCIPNVACKSVKSAMKVNPMYLSEKFLRNQRVQEKIVSNQVDGVFS